MKEALIKRIFLYFLIVSFLVLDYISFSSGIQILDDLKRTGLLGIIFPLLYVLILVTAVLSVKGKVTKLGIKKLTTLLLLLAVSLAYFLSLREATQKIHFLQYEILTILVFKAVQIDLRSKLTYLITFTAVIFFGFIEEIAQATYPDRSFDLGDLGIDITSCVIILMIIAIFHENKTVKIVTDN